MVTVKWRISEVVRAGNGTLGVCAAARSSVLVLLLPLHAWLRVAFVWCLERCSTHSLIMLLDYAVRLSLIHI